MAEQKAKGSIIYEILIVIFSVMLVGSILYPKKVTKTELRNSALCQHRMSELQKAGLQYQKYHGFYTDTLEQMMSFARNDSTYKAYVDSLIVGGVDSVMRRLDEFGQREQKIKMLIPSATDTVMIDSLIGLQDEIKLDARSLAGYVEFVHDRMKNLPNMPIEELKTVFLIVDSKKFTLDMEIVKNSIASGLLEEALNAADNVLGMFTGISGQFESVKNRVPDYVDSRLDSLAFCPTIRRTIQLAHIDTSVIKHLNIYCPIDSSDIAAVKGNFLKSKIAGLTLENHGRIESGEKSWEESR